MNNLKKAVAALTAITTIATSAMSIAGATLSASAATAYCKLGDVDGDGRVSQADYQLLYDYLKGKLILSSLQLSRADSNMDKIVDFNDCDYIYNVYSGKVQGKTVKREKLSVPENTQRSYLNFKYVSGGGSNYTKYSLPRLTANSTSTNAVDVLSSGYRPEGRTDYSNENVVQIETDSGTYSGFIVGDNVIATSADAVYDFEEDDLKTNICINLYKGSDTLIEETDIVPDTIHIPSEYISKKTPSFNYALIKVSEDIAAYIKTDSWSLGFATEGFKTSDSTVEVTGYLNGSRQISYESVKQSNTVHSDNTSNINMFECSTNDMGFALANGTRIGGVAISLNGSALGITSEFAGYDSSGNKIDNSTTSVVRFTPTLAQFYLNNPYVN